ncbi:nuclear transport factor 2 family protein [Luteimonas aquatica]|uniref:nuclear transport factor 2 family protein n=1 Tax=Luteimonas aquatica TaxID=450364 RepID=UPI001F581359|nr:nuclear transport factor 2 family protein [Luteimonas aquatica]
MTRFETRLLSCAALLMAQTCLPASAAPAPWPSRPEEAISAYAKAVADNDPGLLGKAFQPSAMMYCTAGDKVTATSQSQWKERMRTASSQKGPVSTTPEWIESGKQTAIARVSAVRGGKSYVDYLLLARLGQAWRIVGKVCQEGADSDTASTRGIEDTIARKVDGDTRWADSALTETIAPRALVMSVDAGELVASTLEEWRARYAERREKSPHNPVRVLSRHVDTRGNIGSAVWRFRSGSGGVWEDRALFLKTPAGWRMMALIFTQQE